ncbi:MAG: hypothetical protein GY803_18120 [Chloroflexi bacterium]|nr:hypothetical protein [Chloroflexota bacterium]
MSPEAFDMLFPYIDCLGLNDAVIQPPVFFAEPPFLKRQPLSRSLSVLTLPTPRCAVKKGRVSQDHVHLYVSYSPKILVSEMVRRIKGRSSRKIQDEYP